MRFLRRFLRRSLRLFVRHVMDNPVLFVSYIGALLSSYPCFKVVMRMFSEDGIHGLFFDLQCWFEGLSDKFSYMMSHGRFVSGGRLFLSDFVTEVLPFLSKYVPCVLVFILLFPFVAWIRRMGKRVAVGVIIAFVVGFVVMFSYVNRPPKDRIYIDCNEPGFPSMTYEEVLEYQDLLRSYGVDVGEK